MLPVPASRQNTRHRTAQRREVHVLEGDEETIITQFFMQYRACVKKQMQMISHGGMNFDWPFIIRRAWVLGIKVPGDLVIPSGKYWNWNKLLIDTGHLWLLGQYPRDTRWSLDAVGHALGFGGKNVEASRARASGVCTTRTESLPEVSGERLSSTVEDIL